MKNSGIEWIGEIPDDWEIKTVKQLLFERIEKNMDYQTSTILSLSAKDGITLYDGENHSGNRPREDLSNYKVVYPQDIVVNSMNILSGAVGLSKYKGCVSPVYYIYYAKTNNCIEFLHYIFQCKQFQASLRGLGNGILIKESENGNLNTIRMRIPSQKLSIQQLPYCVKDEQQKIADYLDKKCAAVDRLIENQRAQIEKLKEYKQSVITEAVTHGLDLSSPLKDSGVEWLGKIPVKWNVNRLKYRTTYNDEILKDSTPQEEIIRYVEIGSVSLENGVEKIEEYAFKDAPSRARRIAKKDDIIISTVRTYLKAIASIKEEQLIVSTGFCVLRSNNQINNKYLEYFCKSNLFTEYVSANSYGISYPAINASSLVAFHIIEPLIEEQQQIAAYLDKKCAEIDKLISIKQQKIETLTEYKKSLIYEYVTGKKEVVS